jgi:AcrR family transcriptional regulator
VLNARTRTRPAHNAAAPAAAAAEPAADRKRTILLAAERLFATHGYHAVSIRQIADEAEVPLALVGYHYGPKHELFHAIFAHWASTIDARLAALAEARSGPPRGRLAAIVRAFVEPVLRLRASDEGEYYALLVARELFHRSPETERALREFFDPMALAFIDALAEAVPGSSRPQMAWCYQFALGALLHHISDDRVERLSHGQARRGDPAAADALVAFICSGIKTAAPLAPTGTGSVPTSNPKLRRQR